MRTGLLFLFFIVFLFHPVDAQDNQTSPTLKRHGVVWTGGLFKSWLTDTSVGFNKIGNQVNPVYSEQKKMGFAIQSHYMYKPLNWMGIGIHLGLGMDANSYIEAPVVLFGGSISFGNNHQFMIDFGWADAKRKIVPGGVRDQLSQGNLTEIPEIQQQTELNTSYYLGIGYRIF